MGDLHRIDLFVAQGELVVRLISRDDQGREWTEAEGRMPIADLAPTTPEKG